MTDKVFEDSLAKLKLTIGDLEINAKSIITVVRFAIEVVEVTQVKGEEQRILAVRLVKKVVEDAPISDDKEKFLLDMINEGILDNTIDLVVDASNGNININTVVKVASGCCAIFKK